MFSLTDVRQDKKLFEWIGDKFQTLFICEDHAIHAKGCQMLLNRLDILVAASFAQPSSMSVAVSDVSFGAERNAAAGGELKGVSCSFFGNRIVMNGNFPKT